MAKTGINLVSQELVQNHLSQIIDSKHIQGFVQVKTWIYNESVVLFS